jgi:hypothetical protein
VLAVRAAVTWVPLGATAPLQPPEPVQAVALVELHVRVLVAPLPTDVGVAASDTVGAVGWTFCPALQAINSNKAVIDSARAKSLARSMNAFETGHRMAPTR